MLFADDISWKDAASFVTALGVAVSAILSALAAIYAAKAKAHAAAAETHTEENSKAMLGVKSDVKEVQANVAKIEVATNSMKDALVLATHDAAFAAGKDKGTADQKAKQDTGPGNREAGDP